MKSSMLKYKWMCVAVLCCAMFAACEPTGVDTSASDKNLITFGGRKNAYMTQINDPNAKMWGYYVNDGETKVNWVFGSEASNTLSGVDSKVYEKEENGTTKKWVIDIASPTKYWTTGTYDFFSLYSEEGTIPTMTRNNNNLPTFTYNIESQHEIRLAKALGVDGGESLGYTNSNASDRTAPVDFTYNHILSRIKFRGSSSIEGMTIKMTKFIVTATKTAEYAIEADDDVTCTPAPATETVQLPYADGVTTIEKADGFKYKDEADGEGNKITLLKYTELPYAPTLAEGKVLKKIEGEAENRAETDEDYGWLVFPTTADKISIIVEYVDNQGIITQKDATLPSTELEMGKSYIFQFSIQPAGPIVFDNEVIINDWGTETDAGDVQF